MVNKENIPQYKAAIITPKGIRFVSFTLKGTMNW
jgi:hypothetical protein